MITYRRGRSSDARRLLEVSRNVNVMRYYGEPPYKDMDQALAEIAWFEELEKTETGFRFVITDDDVYIGNIGVFNYDPLEGVELGYQLDESYWGQGIMTSAIQDILDICFTKYPYKRVYAVVDVRNNASRKVLLKNKFQLQRREIEAESGDTVEIYAILCDEYVKQTETQQT